MASNPRAYATQPIQQTGVIIHDSLPTPEQAASSDELKGRLKATIADWYARLVRGDRSGPVPPEGIVDPLREHAAKRGWCTWIDGSTKDKILRFAPHVEEHEPELRPVVIRVPELLSAVGHDYRRVLSTTDDLQIIAMALPPGDIVGPETHPGSDQAIHVCAGSGVLRYEVNGIPTDHPVGPGDVAVIPAGTEHTLTATSTSTPGDSGLPALEVLTMYAPPLHSPGVVHRTRQVADGDYQEIAAVEARGKLRRVSLALGDYVMPARYPLAVTVPSGPGGGARCSTCRFWASDPTGTAPGECENRLYREAHGSGAIGAPPDAWCCAAWTAPGVGGDDVAADDVRTAGGPVTAPGNGQPVPQGR